MLESTSNCGKRYEMITNVGNDGKRQQNFEITLNSLN